MLKLERLELSGFKSFVDPTRVEFAGGMTGIVGPNGCGKSNLSDAMVWVMGERSAKSLRGETMEDVIFAGAANRKPLGMAEVTLTLSTLEGFEVPAAQEGRITIGRQLFRSGESHYLLNGKRVRLKDVRDLLMDTGLGLRSYSVIEQGRIGMILSGKPQERRRLLEEAAGITRYRERRRLAEVKLEEARANLERLDDIVAEVERSLRALKRQSNAARRYGERQETYRELLRTVLTARWDDLEARLIALRARIAGEVSKEAELTARLHTEEAGVAAGRETLEAIRHQLTDKHRRHADLAARIEGKQEFLKGSRERLGELGERVHAGDAAVERRRGQLGELKAGLAVASEKEAELLGERERAASDVSDDQRRISQVEGLVAEAEQRQESLRGRLLAGIGDLNGLRNRLHREQVDHEKGELRRRHLAEELERKSKDLAEAETLAAEARATLATLRRRLDEEEARHSAESEELERLITRGEELDAERDQTETRLARLRQRREVLTELGRAHREHREALTDALLEADVDRPRFLAEGLNAPAGWERSLDLYFGELADAVVLPPGVEPLTVASSLTSGPVTARLLSPVDGGPRDAEIDDPAVGASLGEALGLAPEVAAALPAAYLVESAADAARLARAHRGVAFITRDLVWAEGGVVHVQGLEARPGILAREQELAGVEERIPPLERDLVDVNRRLEEAIGATAAKRAQIADVGAALAETRQHIAVARARDEDLGGRERRLKVERETVEAEAAEVEREIALLTERAAALTAELGRGEETHAEIESAFDAAQREVEDAKGRRESVRTSGASRQGRLELAEERLTSHRQELARLRQEIDESERSIETWRDERERLESRRTEIGEAMRAAEDDLQKALEEREELKLELAGEQELSEAKRVEVAAAEEAVEGLRGERDALREALSELRVEEATLAQDSEHLAADFEREFKEPPPAEPSERPEDMPAVEAELERMKNLLERMGPVNVLAADEYNEQQERHEFLTTQRADVASSVDQLRTTIREINRTSTERFRVAFEEVNENFRKTFTELFRGGTAEMRLQDEDDLLESGLEIVARPPGKRLQNLLLLSGGEKALTAIALLFALFRTKPSPFCILDEVDAPLDDINTMRFVELLKRMVGETQFIVITHNKITMEAVATLYGVTMQEKGVSSLVSVELDDVQPDPPPGSAEPEREAVAVPA